MASKQTGISRLKPPTKVTINFEAGTSSAPLSPIINRIPQLRKPPRRSKSFDCNFVKNKPSQTTIGKRKGSLTKISTTSDTIKSSIINNSIKRTVLPNKTLPRVATTTIAKTVLQPKKVLPVKSNITANIRPTTTKTTVSSKPGPSKQAVTKEKQVKPISALATRKRKSEVKPEGIWKKPAKFVDFKTRYNNLSEKFKQKIQDLKDRNDEIEDLIKKNEENAIECQALKLEIQKLKQENSDLKRENKAHVSKITELNINFENFQHQMNSLNEQLTTTTDELFDKQNEILECHEKLRNVDYERRFLLNTIQDLKGNIRVFCRVRPPLNNEEERELAQIAVLDETTLELQKKDFVNTKNPQEFSYDKVFPAGSPQEIVFEDLSELVQSTLDGYNICVFAYGQTGSGKTFTMQGNRNDLGMIPRAIDLLFKKMKEMSILDWTFTIHASFLEIYNEAIVDLLNPKSKHQYDIRHTKETTTVTNLTRQRINTARELYDLMYEALQNRSVASTNFNEHSSRSHAITKIDIEGVQDITNIIHRSSMNLVDLAGSESAKTSTNERMKETKNINKSLSALGNVMLSLYNKDSHVPYRDSKLTYLLQPCLGGNSKTLMIVNIAPFEDTYNETINSLRFAAKVKEVKVNVKRNRILTK